MLEWNRVFEFVDSDRDVRNYERNSFYVVVKFGLSLEIIVEFYFGYRSLRYSVDKGDVCCYNV